MSFIEQGEFYEYVSVGSLIAIRSGFNFVQFSAIGAGGAGRFGAGGAGARVQYTQRVLESEWGGSLGVVIGRGASSANGGASYVYGTLNGASIGTPTAGGGTRSSAAGGAGGAGGTYSGGGSGLDDVSINGDVGGDAEMSAPTYGIQALPPSGMYFRANIGGYGEGGGGDASLRIAGQDGILEIRWIK